MRGGTRASPSASKVGENATGKDADARAAAATGSAGPAKSVTSSPEQGVEVALAALGGGDVTAAALALEPVKPAVVGDGEALPVAVDQLDQARTRAGRGDEEGHVRARRPGRDPAEQLGDVLGEEPAVQHRGQVGVDIARDQLAGEQCPELGPLLAQPRSWPVRRGRIERAAPGDRGGQKRAVETPGARAGDDVDDHAPRIAR